MSSDWSDFSALNDEDELDELRIDTRDYAAEEDSQEAKAQIGASLEPPTIENDAPPIEVPAGTPPSKKVVASFINRHCSLIRQ